MLTANRIRPYTLPWRFFEQVHEDFNRELSDWFTSGATHDASVGVWTKDGSALIAMELPGRELADIDVTVHRNGLKIEAKSTVDESLLESANFLRRERSGQGVQRSFQFPFEVDPESVEATYERGLLVVRLSAHESAQPAKIEVKAG
jgi:HSP20 family protein